MRHLSRIRALVPRPAPCVTAIQPILRAANSKGFFVGEEHYGRNRDEGS